MDDLLTSIRKIMADGERTTAEPRPPLAEPLRAARPERPPPLEEAVGRQLASAFERLDRAPAGPDAAETVRTEALRYWSGAPERETRAPERAVVAEERRLAPPPPAVIYAPAPEPEVEAEEEAEGAEPAMLRAVAEAVEHAPADLPAQPAPHRAPDEDAADGPRRRLRERLIRHPAEADAVASEGAAAAESEPAPRLPPFRARPAVDPARLADDVRRRATDEALCSARTRAGVGAAFDQLNRTVLSPNPRTLEDLVREMMKPMLREWLDANLTEIVERQVAEEIDRLSRGR